MLTLSEKQLWTVMCLAHVHPFTNVTQTKTGAVRVYNGRCWHQVNPDGKVANR
jgi:hypothetical protein